MLYKGCFILVLLDIDGGYTEWSGWSRCTAVCDGTAGRKRQSRTCTNPKPEGNGKTCEEQELGPAERYKKCTNNCDVLIIFAYWPFIVPALVVFCLFSCLCCFIYWKRQNKRKTRERLLALRDLAEGEHPPRYSESREPQLNSARRAPLQGTCVPYTRESQAAAGNPLEVLMVELPPLCSGELPSPRYSGEQSPPPYREEQPPPPYSGETATNTREEPPPPYPEEEHVPEYAVKSFV